MTIRTPARKHTKARRYGPRIQKKWNKRYGFTLTVRDAIAQQEVTETGVNPLSRRGRAMLHAARANRTEEEWHEIYDRKLAALCERMIEECRVGGWTKVQFNVANQYEHDFIKTWMSVRAPTADIVFNYEV